MAGQHIRWAPARSQADDPQRAAIRQALALGQALADVRSHARP